MAGVLDEVRSPVTTLRAPDVVMRLSRLGAMHMSRLSFTRTLVRTARRDGWRVRRVVFDLDAEGYGRAVYAVGIGGRDYSLVAFSQYLAPEDRIDRVIAQAWDTCYVLYDGVPDAAELDRLAACVPYQEARRYSEREFVLARANNSERLFDHVRDALAAGRQPDEAMIREVGYLLRTSAVYGNGKFGIADYSVVSSRPEFAGPFVAEMLTVWLIRAFTVDLVEHRAREAAPATAVRLAPRLRRLVGIGNSTGLGMAPFLVRHPALIHRWVHARERALCRVRAIPRLDEAPRTAVLRLLAEAESRFADWATVDELQAARIATLRADLRIAGGWVAAMPAGTARPWDAVHRRAAGLGLEAQEFLVSAFIEPHGDLVDDLTAEMGLAGEELRRLDGTMSVGRLADIVADHYGWAVATDFAAPDAVARFWYTSQEKLEPRLGWRGDDDGEALELPLGPARDVAALAVALAGRDPTGSVGALALARPDLRHVVRRVQTVAHSPYGEIRDNLLDARIRPIDLMRCKLSFFGAEFYDPRSDLSLRIRLFVGAPFPDEIEEAGDDAFGW